MAKRSHPLTVACRVNAREQAKVDAAARLKGLSRADYIRAAVLSAADSHLREELEQDVDSGHA